MVTLRLRHLLERNMEKEANANRAHYVVGYMIAVYIVITYTVSAIKAVRDRRAINARNAARRAGVCKSKKRSKKLNIIIVPDKRREKHSKRVHRSLPEKLDKTENSSAAFTQKLSKRISSSHVDFPVQAVSRFTLELPNIGREDITRTTITSQRTCEDSEPAKMLELSSVEVRKATRMQL